MVNVNEESKLVIENKILKYKLIALSKSWKRFIYETCSRKCLKEAKEEIINKITHDLEKLEKEGYILNDYDRLLVEQIINSITTLKRKRKINTMIKEIEKNKCRILST